MEERQSVWNYFIAGAGNKPPVIRSNLEKIRNNFLSEEQCETIKIIAKENNKFLNELDESNIHEDELKNSFLKYKNGIRECFSEPTIQNNQKAQSIFSLFKKLIFFIDKISENEFMNLYRPLTLKSNFLPLQLGKIFIDYRVKEYEEYHKNLEMKSLKNRASLTDVNFRILKHHNTTHELKYCHMPLIPILLFLLLFQQKFSNPH